MDWDFPVCLSALGENAMGWGLRTSGLSCAGLFVALGVTLCPGASPFFDPSATVAGSESADPSVLTAWTESSGSKDQPVW